MQKIREWARRRRSRRSPVLVSHDFSQLERRRHEAMGDTFVETLCSKAPTVTHRAITVAGSAMYGSKAGTAQRTSQYMAANAGAVDIDNILRYEFQGRAFIDVNGFHEKVFEDVDDNILRDVGAFEPGNWEGWPDHGTEEQRATFWFNFQDKLLAALEHNSPSVSLPQWRFKDCRKEVVAHANLEVNKPDIVLVPNSQVASDTDFVDTYCTGDLKLKSDKKPAYFLQIARYARSILFHHADLAFAHCFLLENAIMRNWIFNRSGAFSGHRFDINQEKTKFVQVFLGYLRMGIGALGSVQGIQKIADAFLLDLPTGSTIWLNPDLLFHVNAIVCRGTACYAGMTERLKGSEHAEPCAVKIAWIVDGAGSEVEFLEVARKFNIKNVARVMDYADITSTSELQAPLQLDIQAPIPLTPLQMHAGSNDVPVGTGWANRTCRAIVTTPLGKSLEAFENLFYLLSAFKDAIVAHFELYSKAKILHRDISDRNIILTEAAGVHAGCLIDFDHAVFYDREKKEEYHRTGTLPFMAIGILKGTAEHSYRHDLESFFYVLVWVLYSCSGRHQDLDRWCQGLPSQIADIKRGFVANSIDKMCAGFLPKHQCKALQDLVHEFRFALFYKDYGYGSEALTPFIENPRNPRKMFKAVDSAFSKALKELRKSEHAQKAGAQPIDPKSAEVSGSSEHKVGTHEADSQPNDPKSAEVGGSSEWTHETGAQSNDPNSMDVTV